MKPKQLLPAIFAAALILCGFNPIARADDLADRAALRLIRTNYMEAANSGDLSKIAPYLSKEVTGVMVTGEEIKGFEGLKAYWKKIQNLIGPGGSYHITVNTDDTTLYGNVAVSRGNTEEVVRLATGKELRFSSSWTAVCRKEDGAWKVIRIQATMNPVNNVFVTLNLQKTKFEYGLGGVILGAALFLAISLARRSSRSGPVRAT
ncbi:MAG TPA: nuclear transport factor 2 family protein [Verrucomicrobiae bacterium]